MALILAPDDKIDRLLAALREAEAALSMLPCGRHVAAREARKDWMPIECRARSNKQGMAFLCVRCGALTVVRDALAAYPTPEQAFLSEEE